MKEVKQYLKVLRRRGLVVEQLKSSHWRVSTPDGRRLITVASSPSCPHWKKNSEAALRRALREEVPA